MKKIDERRKSRGKEKSIFHGMVGDNMNKMELSERDICTKFITPSMEAAGWDLKSQIREEKTFTNGKIIVKGNKIKRVKKKLIIFCIINRIFPLPSSK